MAVFAFDRDWTVDVNPHPRKQSVPLEWVHHLAHNTTHAVYAIGNQTLATEAAIPGVIDIVGRHPDPWDDWLGDKRPNGRYEQFPNRRDRLALIEDLHPDTEEYIVVDDRDLSDVTGWNHYHAWEFVPAVQNGDIDPDLPWCEHRPDGGGYPASAGIIPADVDDLREFLDDHADADAFQIEYTHDGDPRTRVVADASIIERTVKRPAAAITIECRGLPPGTGDFHVRFNDIRVVHAVTPPDHLFDIHGDTPTERAQTLADIAAVAPDRIDLAVVVDLLGSSHPTAREAAINAVEHLAGERPADCVAVLPALRSRLADNDHTSQVLECLAALAAADPGEIAPYIDDITPYLQADDEQTQRPAARIHSEVATHDPADVVNAVPALSTIVADQGPGFTYAVFALNKVADDHPSEVRPAARDLAAVLADDSLNADTRLNATAALGKIASEYPDAAIDELDPVTRLLDADSQRLRANAAGVLSDIATGYPSALVPYIEAIAGLLDSDDDYALVNTTAAVSRIADTNPQAVNQHTDQLTALLDHDHRLVRLNACWALGHLEAGEAASRLEAVKTNDNDDAIRKRAAWALSEIESAQ